MITDRDIADRLAEHTENLVLDYLAAGLDPDRANAVADATLAEVRAVMGAI
ncbi:hypothetical protein [Kitasatospora aureofaciens]|uniref:hypothetical protein n=1 Tax=Kitasatospora aureofaciens TaxID=1894 RepID=UPI001C490B86|nr:hypothetical protein [Kitasatospora aureofaciens]MBV6698555.1 hypothetical protein [Kitasatospora aureofaciens]